MKSLWITIDEALLERLDADDEVRRDGRSVVIRRAITEYLGRRERQRIAESYRRGYGSGVCQELAGWVGVGTWPEA